MMEEMLISMLQKMTGLSPEQMQDMTNKAMGMLNTFTAEMQDMRAALNRIEEALSIQTGKVSENDGNNCNGGNANGNVGTIIDGTFHERN